MPVHQGAFPAAELAAVPPARNGVVLKSGGPVMELVTVEGDQALCQWEEWDRGGNYNVKYRRLFSVASLLRCVPLIDGNGFPESDLPS